MADKLKKFKCLFCGKPCHAEAVCQKCGDKLTTEQVESLFAWADIELGCRADAERLRREKKPKPKRKAKPKPKRKAKPKPKG
jgi:hypothetical protein